MRRRAGRRGAGGRRPRGNARARPGARAGRLADGRSPPRHQRVPGGDARAWMGRGRHPRDRVRLCGGSARAAAGARGRPGARPGSARRRIRLGCRRGGACAHHGEAGRRRFDGRGRRRRREPRPAFRQSHRHFADDRSDGGEMGRGAGRAAPLIDPLRRCPRRIAHQQAAVRKREAGGGDAWPRSDLAGDREPPRRARRGDRLGSS